MIVESNILTVMAANKLKNSETDLRRIPLEVEDAILAKIKEGRYDQIHLAKISKLVDDMGRMAQDSLQHCKFTVVSAISIFTRAAIEGGALPDDVFDLSDALIYSLSYCTNMDDISDIYALSAIMLAKQVHAAKTKSYSVKVERIISYISQNIFRKITLKDLSEYVGLSPNYMCNLFSREMGISIHNYIQKEKIAVSCNLLKFSDRNISDIAAYMGFQSQSNYAAVFKKWIHLTPDQYRKANHTEVF